MLSIALLFALQGKYLAVAGGGSASVKLWSTSSWQIESSLNLPRADSVGGAGSAAKEKPGDKFVLAVAWRHDGQRLACSAMDGTVAVFDVARAKLLHTLEGHTMPVRSLSFSPVDPRVLYTVSQPIMSSVCGSCCKCIHNLAAIGWP